MLERITYDPKILGGKPIIKGTRISVQFILELLAAGITVDEIVDQYPNLEREDVLAAINYAARTSQTIIPEPPVHPLSSFVTIVLDWLWFVLEAGVTIPIATLPALLPIVVACGTMCFISVMLVQHYVAHDDWGASIAKGLVMGVVAGVPYPVAGTALGGVLLGWAGVHRAEVMIRKLPPRS